VPRSLGCHFLHTGIYGRWNGPRKNLININVYTLSDYIATQALKRPRDYICVVVSQQCGIFFVFHFIM
jgi:hypothetical protein